MPILDATHLQDHKTGVTNGFWTDPTVLPSLVQTLNAKTTADADRLAAIEVLGLYARTGADTEAVLDAVQKVHFSFEQFFNKAEIAARGAAPDSPAYIMADELHRYWSGMCLVFGRGVGGCFGNSGWVGGWVGWWVGGCPSNPLPPRSSGGGTFFRVWVLMCSRQGCMRVGG